jgi:hypothetical protein
VQELTCKVGPTFYERVFRAKPASKFTVERADQYILEDDSPLMEEKEDVIVSTG